MAKAFRTKIRHIYNKRIFSIFKPPVYYLFITHNSITIIEVLKRGIFQAAIYKDLSRMLGFC